MAVPFTRRTSTADPTLDDLLPFLEYSTGRDLCYLSKSFLSVKEDTHPGEEKHLRLLMTDEEVGLAVKELSKVINTRYHRTSEQREPVLMVGILNGVCFFFSHLMGQLDIPYEITFIKVETYHGQKQSTERPDMIVLDTKLVQPGKQILLLDELEDNGTTLTYCKEKLVSLGAREEDITTCVLFSKQKPDRPARADHLAGISTPDVWLVGWGLDHRKQKRGWKYLYALAKDEGLPHTADDKMFEDGPEGRATYSRARRMLMEQLQKMAS